MAAPALVFDQSMRNRHVAGLIDLVLAQRVLQRQPQQRADPGPKRQPPCRASQPIRLLMHADVHATGKVSARTKHGVLRG